MGRAKTLLNKMTWDELVSVCDFFGLDELRSQDYLGELKLCHLLTYFGHMCGHFQGQFTDGLLTVLDFHRRGKVGDLKKKDYHFQNDHDLNTAVDLLMKYFHEGNWKEVYLRSDHWVNQA